MEGRDTPDWLPGGPELPAARPRYKGGVFRPSPQPPLISCPRGAAQLAGNQSTKVPVPLSLAQRRELESVTSTSMP